MSARTESRVARCTFGVRRSAGRGVRRGAPCRLILSARAFPLIGHWPSSARDQFAMLRRPASSARFHEAPLALAIDRPRRRRSCRAKNSRHSGSTEAGSASICGLELFDIGGVAAKQERRICECGVRRRTPRSAAAIASIAVLTRHRFFLSPRRRLSGRSRVPAAFPPIIDV